jgi:carboxypeptidase D
MLWLIIGCRGMYCPYIASAMLDRKDTTYYNMSGMLIYDPVIGADELATKMTAVPFSDYWKGLFPFNDSFVADIHKRHESCGYKAHIDKYLAYPPPGQQPVILASQNSTGGLRPECASLFDDVFNAVALVNPCFDIYAVTTTCPLLWDVLGCELPTMLVGTFVLHMLRH